MAEQKYLYLESAEGMMCRIPEDKAEAWLKKQEERKRNGQLHDMDELKTYLGSHTKEAR